MIYLLYLVAGLTESVGSIMAWGIDMISDAGGHRLDNFSDLSLPQLIKLASAERNRSAHRCEAVSL